MQDDANYYLIQPTLQWDTDSKSPLTYTASSWFVWVLDPNTPDYDDEYYTIPFSVSPGHQLGLEVWGSNCTDQGTCGTWIIETFDANLSYGTYIELDNFTFRMERILGGVLEFPGSVADAQTNYLTASQYSCSDFPGDDALFSNIAVYYGTLSNPTSYYADSNPNWLVHDAPYPSNLSTCAPRGGVPFEVDTWATSVQISW